MDPGRIRGPAHSIDDIEARRDHILSRIVELLQRDHRVVAAWLTGSFGRGDDDAWSDLDLHVAVVDDELDDWWDERLTLYEAIATVVLVQREMPSNAQDGAHFQLMYFSGPVEVDWNVGPVSRAYRPETSLMLLARQDIPLAKGPATSEQQWRDTLQQEVDFFWTMTPIAVKYCGRQATTDAVDQIDLMIRGLSRVWRFLHHSANLHSLNPRMEPELANLMPTLGANIDPGRCLDQIVGLTAAMTSLDPQLDAAGVTPPGELIAEIEVMIGVAQDVLRG